MAKTPAKRLKITDSHRHPPLIHGLPDHIAQLCLSHVHPSLLYSVCHSWRRVLYSPSFPPFFSLYALFSTDQCLANSIHFFSFDPFSSKWDPLPPPPPDPPLRLLHRHPSFLSRNLPIQSISVSGHLVLLAASTHDFFPALSCPLIFSPISRSWTFGPRLATPRRWCAAGASRGVVYVASGIGSHFSNDVARSMEKWDSNLQPNKICYENHRPKWRWEKMRGLKDGKFSRDAIDAIGWRGKLCMVNVKGDAAKEGLVYDVEKDLWEEMPEGMLMGWRGPVAAMDEEVMYVVDEKKGVVRKYDAKTDSWEDVMESGRLKGAQQIAAGGGRVCIVCGDGEIVVVNGNRYRPSAGYL
ncbi:hypothetical protein SLEP1_g21889 [Rubroshorea leprosula]|uniref:F-box/kelch-repeat protein SKIP25-like n=1 Tax=Rubroshorea leprosula TaxID=152421 RepID=A0AAV5JI10_9ROSI|nr:hypothetical protein SLEP1_g21889 [Rubroshorea leprosula]